MKKWHSYKLSDVVRFNPSERLLKGEIAKKVPMDFWDKLGNRIPMQRSGTPADIAEAVVWLASEKASYITGTTLRVDGGLILPGMPELIDETGADKGWGYTQPKDF